MGGAAKAELSERHSAPMAVAATAAALSMEGSFDAIAL